MLKFNHKFINGCQCLVIHPETEISEIIKKLYSDFLAAKLADEPIDILEIMKRYRIQRREMKEFISFNLVKHTQSISNKFQIVHFDLWGNTPYSVNATENFDTLYQILENKKTAFLFPNAVFDEYSLYNFTDYTKSSVSTTSLLT